MRALLATGLAVCIAAAPSSLSAQRFPGRISFFTSPADKIYFSADELDYLRKEHQLIFSGSVEMRQGKIHLRADRAILDLRRDHLLAQGGVSVVEGNQVILSEEFEANVKDLTGVIRRAVIYIKKRIAPAALALLEGEDLEAAGRNEVTFSGRLIRKTGERTYEVERALFTPCDCDGGRPSWSIGAWCADLELEEDAWLTMPVFYVKDLPVFLLPYFYLPLAERKTGLLFPRVAYSGRSKLIIQNAFYLTLGRSADATFYLDILNTLGQGSRGRGSTNPVGGRRRLRKDLELRWLPARGWEGYFFGTLVSEPLLKTEEAGDEGRDVDRFSLQLNQQARFSPRAGGFARIFLLSDRTYITDYSSELALRTTQHTASHAGGSYRWPNAVLGAWGTYYQDLMARGGDPLAGDQGALESQLLFKAMQPFTIHRLPEVAFTLLPRPILGGRLLVGLEAELVNYAGMGDALLDVGTDGLPGYGARGRAPDPDGSEGNGIYDAGELLRRITRLSIKPEISLPLAFSRYFMLTPNIAYRQSLYLSPVSTVRGDGDDRPVHGFPAHLGYLRLGAEGASELSRIFGTIKHSIAPRFRYAKVERLIDTTRAGLAPDFDEVDRVGDAHQLLFLLENRLTEKVRGGRYLQRLKLTLSQGINLDAGKKVEPDLPVGEAAVIEEERRFTELAARLTARAGPATLHTLAAYDWRDEIIRRAMVSLGLRNRRGDSVSLGYNYLVVGGSSDLLQGLEEIFGIPADEPLGPYTFARAASLTPRGASMLPVKEVRLGWQAKIYDGLSLSYSMINSPEGIVLNIPLSEAEAEETGETYREVKYRFLQQALGLNYRSPCDCWSLRVRVTLRPDEKNECGGNYCEDVMVMLDLTKLGSVGGGTGPRGLGISVR